MENDELIEVLFSIDASLKNILRVLLKLEDLVDEELENGQ